MLGVSMAPALIKPGILLRNNVQTFPRNLLPLVSLEFPETACKRRGFHVGRLEKKEGFPLIAIRQTFFMILVKIFLTLATTYDVS